MHRCSLAGAAALVGQAVIASCGTPPAMHAPVAERLIAIRIEGNRAIARESLEPALALHEVIVDGAAADPYLVAADADRIRAAYIKRGFFAVKVTGDVVPGERGQAAVFTVIEGRRAVTRVEIGGLPPELPLSAARTRIKLDDGAPFDYDAYDAAKLPLTELVQDAGYARAKLDGQVTADPDGAVAVAHYEVSPGQPCRFGAIEVGAVHPDLQAAVRARLAFATGDRYSVSSLAKSQAQIFQLGRFSSVQLVADRSGERSIIDVKVDLVEISRHELHIRGGVGVDPDTLSVRGGIGGSWIPRGAPLLTAAADASVVQTLLYSGDPNHAPQKLRILGSLQRIDLLWPRVRGEVEGGVDYQTVEAYTWIGPHVRLGLGSPLGPRWLQLHVGWLLEQLDFRDFDRKLTSVAPCDDDNTEAACVARAALGFNRPRRGAFEASLVADLRDDPIEPRAGGYLALSAAWGSELAGGEPDYWQLTPELRGYVPLGGVVVAARARVGVIHGDVPVTERYYAGGTSSQRGFSERQLASRVFLDGDGCSDTADASTDYGPVIGGAGLIETGLELRRQIGTLWDVPLGANLFLDGARVTCKAVELDASLSKLHWATGTGLWLKALGLKIHGDIGYRLNRENDLPPTGTNAFAFHGDLAWHIGIGETF